MANSEEIPNYYRRSAISLATTPFMQRLRKEGSPAVGAIQMLFRDGFDLGIIVHLLEAAHDKQES